MQEIELEKTYLIKYLPETLFTCESKEISDLYISHEGDHPTLRIRQNGEKYEITKKIPNGSDASSQTEHTIVLSQEEFMILSQVEGEKVQKLRYYYPYEGRMAEIDVFQGDLTGLVLVDFEFNTEEEKNSFVMPDFCLVDITQESFIAGGMLAGKSYGDIEERLKKWNYKKVI